MSRLALYICGASLAVVVVGCGSVHQSTARSHGRHLSAAYRRGAAPVARSSRPGSPIAMDDEAHLTVTERRGASFVREAGYLSGTIRGRVTFAVHPLEQSGTFSITTPEGNFRGDLVVTNYSYALTPEGTYITDEGHGIIIAGSGAFAHDRATSLGITGGFLTSADQATFHMQGTLPR